MLSKILKKIPNNNHVIIHSNLLILGKILKNKKLLKKKFLSRFKKGIIIPSFNLIKKKIINFNAYETSMGGLTNIFIKDKKFFRNNNATHSYIFNKLMINKNQFNHNSFGKNSIYDYFTKKNFLWVNFGAANNNGYTLFHHAEALVKVPYRKNLILTKYIKHQDGIIKNKFQYYARKKKIIYNFDKAVNIMLKKKIIKKVFFRNHSITYGNCKNIIAFLKLELKKNKYFLIK